VIGYASFHGWRRAERLVDTGEIVVHEVQGDRMGVVLHLLAEGVGQAGEPPHLHSHREVLPLSVTG